MSEKRQLAAIMFTDMVGYTALMQQNEYEAKLLRDRHRKVLNKQIPEYRGKILQFYGDGTLSVFDSAIDAVRSSIAIQKEFLTDPRIPVRIGIHTGDIAYDEDSIYGDGVNISSRLQSLSVPGGVLISEKVYDEVKNHPEIVAISLGSYSLKNVQKPVEVYAIANEDLVVPDEQDIRSGSNSVEVSLAVLPFVNVSGDADNEYFSDGITEELINVLSKVEGMRVTSRTSSFMYKGKTDDVRSIGRLLNVRNVLEGSVRRSGNKVRICAQLISAADGYQVWSETYNHDLEDIFKVQDEIARMISSKFHRKGAGQYPAGNTPEHATANMEAYSLYLKGLYHWNKQNPEDFTKAIDFFRESIRHDNEFAMPYAALSVAFVTMGSRGLINHEDAMREGMDAAHAALKLNPGLGDAHMALGLFKLFFEWDLEEAYKYFQKALLLNPGKAIIQYAYGSYLVASKKFEEGIEYLRRAVELDPLSILYRCVLGNVYTMINRNDEALKEFEKVQEIDPAARMGLEGVATVCLLNNEYGKAIEMFEELQKMIGNELKGLCRLGYAYGKFGRTEQALDCLTKLGIRQEVEKNVRLHYDYALIYTGLGDIERAVDYFEKAYEDRIGDIIMAINSPVFSALYDNPRFKQLQKKLYAKSRVLG